MHCASLSVFRFARPGAMHWALWQMPLAMPRLRRLPGAGFVKTLGSGIGESFIPVPNFTVYGVLVTWPSVEHARRQVADGGIFQRYREQAAEDFTVYLTPVSARGLWAGQAPFTPPEGVRPAPPYAILTRASIRWWKAPAFWRHSPAHRPAHGGGARHPVQARPRGAALDPAGHLLDLVRHGGDARLRLPPSLSPRRGAHGQGGGLVLRGALRALQCRGAEGTWEGRAHARRRAVAAGGTGLRGAHFRFAAEVDSGTVNPCLQQPAPRSKPPAPAAPRSAATGVPMPS